MADPDEAAPLWQSFDAAYARSEGLGRPRLQRLFRLPLLGQQFRNVWRLLNYRHRYFALRCLAQVGFTNWSLTKSLLSAVVFGGLAVMFYSSGPLLGYAAGAAGFWMALFVIFCLFFFTLMAILSVLDLIPMIAGTIDHARGRIILEETNLADIDDMGRNIFSPRKSQDWGS